MITILAIKCSDADNTAVVFSEDAQSGMTVHVRDKKGMIQEVKLLSDIPYGHKLAVKTIHAGEPVLKYGEVIGVAVRNIDMGEHVHVHNLDSRRARGDLLEKR